MFYFVCSFTGVKGVGEDAEGCKDAISVLGGPLPGYKTLKPLTGYARPPIDDRAELGFTFNVISPRSFTFLDAILLLEQPAMTRQLD